MNIQKENNPITQNHRYCPLYSILLRYYPVDNILAKTSTFFFFIN